MDGEQIKLTFLNSSVPFLEENVDNTFELDIEAVRNAIEGSKP